MSWKEEVTRELRIARESERIGNHGRARTCARRAIGIAADHLQRSDPSYQLGSDAVSRIQSIAGDERFSDPVRRAAKRLGARISKDFSSPSEDPVSDATLVVSDLIERLASSQTRSSER